MPDSDQKKFNELLLSKTRMGIIAALLGGDKLDFTYLKKLLELSDGNLSVQIRKLEEADYIKVEKVFVDRKPKTFCKITPRGQNAIKHLMSKLESLLKSDKKN